MSLMKTALSKAVKWFPYFREMIRMENVCRTAGFDDEQTATLLKGKLLEYSGELDSEGHNCKFTVERVAVRITPDPTDKRKLQLNIDKVPFKEWCREKFEKMRNAFANPYRGNKNTKGRDFETLFQKIANGIMNYSVFNYFCIWIEATLSRHVKRSVMLISKSGT